MAYAYFTAKLVKHDKKWNKALIIAAGIVSFIALLGFIYFVNPELDAFIVYHFWFPLYISFNIFLIIFSWRAYKNYKENHNKKTKLLVVGLSICMILSCLNGLQRYFGPLGSMPNGPIDLFLLLFAGIILADDLADMVKSLYQKVKEKGLEFELKFKPPGEQELMQRKIKKDDTMVVEKANSNRQPENDFGLPMILVIDDEEGVRESLKAGLTGHYIVKTAENGEQAMEMLGYGETSGLGIDPDMVICDVMLKGQLNGNYTMS